MGGQVTLRSDPGRGSCFAFELPTPAVAMEPCEPADHPDAEAPWEPAGPAGAPTPRGCAGRRVLLAEDNALIRELVAGLLEGSGIELELAENGMRAVECFARAPADLVLMDIQMPLLDGCEATRRIRALDPEVPIVALSANAFPEDVAAALAAGMTGHLGKPIDAQALCRLLETHLHAPGEAGPVGAAVGASALRSATDAQVHVHAGHPAEASPRGALEPVLDTAAALHLFDGQEWLYRRQLDGFLARYRDFEPEPGDALGREALHDVRGLSAQVGATRLQRLTAELECATAPADVARLRAEWRQELRAVLTAMQSWLDEHPASRSRPAAL